MLVINETAAATLNPVWIAIVSACAALAGAALTSAVAMRQQRLQRDHDSVENDKDRRAELRREVYLNYVSEFGKAVTMLSQLPEIDLSVARGGDLVEGFFAACAKSKLVSNPETALLIGEVEARFGELLPKMMLKAMPLYDLRSKIELAQQFYDEAQAEVSRLTAARDAHNESGKPDPLVFQVLSIPGP